MTPEYKEKLEELLREAVSPEVLAELVAKARAYAGGKRAAAARSASGCTHGPGETCEFCSSGKKPRSASEFFSVEAKRRLFIEIGPDGLSDWIQIVPGPGKFSHPQYGVIEITNEMLERFVDNFNRKVYQEHIPVDAEHQTKLSGALGYFREMKVGHNGKPGVWARIEFTDRGRQLVEEGAYKYFSPEFYSEWTDPATGITHKDVLIGGAFTTRPFFKDKALEAISMSEFSEVIGENDYAEEAYLADSLYGLIREIAARVVEKALEESNMTEDKKEEATVETTEPIAASEAKALIEQNAALQAQLRSMSEELQRYADTVERMRTEARRKAFSEIVTGRGGANDGGPQWFGDPEKHVEMLERLAKAFGEDSAELKDYIELQNATARAIAESAAFKEAGRSTPETSISTASAIDARVRALIEADKSLSPAKALERVLAENPELYRQYNNEFVKRIN